MINHDAGHVGESVANPRGLPLLKAQQSLLDMFCAKWRLGCLLVEESGQPLVEAVAYNKYTEVSLTADGCSQEEEMKNFIHYFHGQTRPLLLTPFFTLRPYMIFFPIPYMDRTIYAFIGYFLDKKSRNHLENRKGFVCFVHGFDNIPLYTEQEIDTIMEQVSLISDTIRMMYSTDEEQRAHPGRVQDMNTEPLTMREREVFHWIQKGLSNKEIAQKLFISDSTVKTHVSHVFRKLRIEDRKNICQGT